MAASVSLRSLALQLGLSAATVSEALRGSPRVKGETRERILAAAEAAGYRPNPLVGAVMADLRRKQLQGCRGVIGALSSVEMENPLRVRFHEVLLAGASERAEELGFRLDLFHVGDGELSFRRLNTVLLTRGIQGVIVMPFEEAQDWGEVDWSRLSAVRMDYSLRHPVLHTISPDHHTALVHALERLRARGYERIGLFIRRAADRRILYRWSGAFASFNQAIDVANHVPPLLVERMHPEPFFRWWEQYRPDAIVGHHPVVIEWLAERGVRVPKDVGFFNLNTTQEPFPSAGLDLLPRQLGAAAVESVIAQIHRNERGVPAYPKTITIEGAWVDGPTLRPQLEMAQA